MRIKTHIALSILVLLSVIITGCSTSGSSVYAQPDGTYTEITYIDNLSFSIPLSFVNRATAITQIQDGIQYSSNDVYSYNNGVDTYIMFCMDELIILAQKGTSFDFLNAEEKVNGLNNSSVLNTWFNPAGKRFTYDESDQDNAYKIISSVNGEVVITSELYGDYTGKLAVIQSDNTEWSLYVGVVANNINEVSDQQLDVIDSITKSMCLKENIVKSEPTYDVVISQELKSDASQDIPESSDAPTEDTAEESVDDIPEVTETASDRVPTKKGLNLSNQINREKELGKAYSSDIYSMLQPGQCGITSVITENGVENPIIRVNKVYTGEDAIKRIKEYAETQDCYDYYDAPDGYSWHLAEYDISYENCTGTPYMNIKLTGLDGNNLIFRGVPVTKRTHDASYEQRSDNKSVYQMYCYYAVANGCHDYALECGDGTVTDDSLSAAYYHITVK